MRTSSRKAERTCDRCAAGHYRLLILAVEAEIVDCRLGRAQSFVA
jgi:hypothetical protein